MRIDPAWASQSACLQGAAAVAIPGHVIHEDTLAASLAHIESLLGLEPQPVICGQDDSEPFAIADFYDSEIEERVRDVYARDYQIFGFGGWAPLA